MAQSSTSWIMSNWAYATSPLLLRSTCKRNKYHANKNGKTLWHIEILTMRRVSSYTWLYVFCLSMETFKAHPTDRQRNPPTIPYIPPMRLITFLTLFDQAILTVVPPPIKWWSASITPLEQKYRLSRPPVPALFKAGPYGKLNHFDLFPALMAEPTIWILSQSCKMIELRALFVKCSPLARWAKSWYSFFIKVLFEHKLSLASDLL